MRRRLLNLLTVLSLQLCIAAPAAASGSTGSAGRDGATVADFEAGLPPGVRAYDGTAAPQADGAGTSLCLTASGGDKPAQLLLPLPAGLDAGAFDVLSARLRVEAQPERVQAIWEASDESGRTLFRRQFDLAADANWHTFESSRSDWRWAPATVGPWSEVRYLSLVTGPGVRKLWLDDVRLLRRPPADGKRPSDVLLKLAFADRDHRRLEENGLLVAADPAVPLDAGDLRRVLALMGKNRALIRRLLGPAVRPIDTQTPPALLIFADAEGQGRFLARLGDHLSIQIPPPPKELAGYTVQDIGTVVFDRRLGPANPMFVHESFHAILAHDARLVTNHARNSWFHEALANYLQAGVYPRSLPAGVLALNFPKGVSDDRTLFRPLHTVLTGQVPPRDYAQVATLAYYLVEEKPQWLPTLAKALADGQTTERALAACGTTFDDLERAWLAWGQRRFTTATDNPRNHPFEPPPEFAPQ
jgi:hypothetical protein